MLFLTYGKKDYPALFSEELEYFQMATTLYYTYKKPCDKGFLYGRYSCNGIEVVKCDDFSQDTTDPKSDVAFNQFEVTDTVGFVHSKPTVSDSEELWQMEETKLKTAIMERDPMVRYMCNIDIRYDGQPDDE